MRKNYQDFKERNSKDFNKFISKYCFFAYSNKQFQEGLEKVGIPSNTETKDLKKYIVRLDSVGGYLLKDHETEYDKICRKLLKVERKYLNNFKNLYSALLYEMYNHECGYTWNFTDCLSPLGFSRKDLKTNKQLLKAFRKAKQSVIAYEMSKEE